MKKILSLTSTVLMGLTLSTSPMLAQEKWTSVKGSEASTKENIKEEITKPSSSYPTPEKWGDKKEKSLESNGFSESIKPGKGENKKEIKWADAFTDIKTTYKHTLSGIIKEPLK
jgi:hypothetical protein